MLVTRNNGQSWTLNHLLDVPPIPETLILYFAFNTSSKAENPSSKALFNMSLVSAFSPSEAGQQT